MSSAKVLTDKVKRKKILTNLKQYENENSIEAIFRNYRIFEIQRNCVYSKSQHDSISCVLIRKIKE